MIYNTENTRNGRIEKFFQTAFERQIIYVLKEHGAKRPWTEDNQFNTWYFCNVFRYQDKVTKWIIQNIIERYAGDKDLWKKIIVARRLSRIESMEAVGKAGGFVDLEQGRVILKKMVHLGLPIITNAFVQGIPDPCLGTNKIDYMYNLIKFYEDMNILPNAATCGWIQTCTENLMLAPNMGGFLSYEVASDFTYSTQYLKDAKDRLTWANAGPGAIRGLNVIETGFADGHIVNQANSLEYMREVLKEWEDYIGKHFAEYTAEAKSRLGEEPSLIPTKVDKIMGAFLDISMREVEHWLCEFDKHERVGKNKRKYPL
jgi:hypothetical protein